MTSPKRGSKYVLPNNRYEQLVQQVTTAGCFERTYFSHGLLLLSSLLGLTASAYMITYSDNTWLQVGNAVVAAFFSVQLGLFGHDLSHQSVFRSKKLNKNLALIIWGLGCGLSESRWFYKHNAHHQSPNHIDHDPDLDIPFVFTAEQAATRSDFSKKYILPYQHILFWVGVMFVYPFNLLHSMRFLLEKYSWRSLIEIILISGHFLIVLIFTFSQLPFLTAVIFNLVTLLTIGIYMGLIFAPNHKGEDMLSSTEKHNWVHQITLTRNLHHSPIGSYVLGGLDFQVEHHLFPSMSRFKYSAAHAIVISFCTKHNIPYKEVSFSESMKQIHQALHEESRSWRQKTKPC